MYLYSVIILAELYTLVQLATLSLPKITKGWLGIANLKKNYKDRLDLGVTWLK